ncbi:electron transfer flavoprotein beta subunit [Jatrophihabitans endophyticus]|uniref:Electron transfer flavoprotein beta subunit n=1 Tax=Jatrophihabitans endophyticus TaxID=1206085 RepID=A0A1M5N6W7_9ACTN|nr:electron transfer flavoprotein subunit beta/FixA family protein [Jatrophihabitans endophyticus]SHG85294.1 electron transfer flavoprotein beta subunit [Jatrophihabitans endophyticus]
MATDVLVCIKRVPDVSGEVLLADDEQSLDARHVGFTVSPHEECAVELATQLAEADGGSVTVLTVGSADAVEQLRGALAVGCTDGVLVEADTATWGPVDVAAAIADVVRSRAEAGRSYDLVLLGNDAADTGDFQVPIRLAHALDRPVVTGISKVEIDGGTAVAHGDGPDGTEVYELPLPAVVAVMEGGVSPRYPSIPGRMKAKRAPVETVTPQDEPRGSGRVRLTLPPRRASTVQVLGRGPEAAPAVVDLLVEIGVVAR